MRPDQTGCGSLHGWRIQRLPIHDPPRPIPFKWRRPIDMLGHHRMQDSINVRALGRTKASVPVDRGRLLSNRWIGVVVAAAAGIVACVVRGIVHLFGRLLDRQYSELVHWTMTNPIIAQGEIRSFSPSVARARHPDVAGKAMAGANRLSRQIKVEALMNVVRVQRIASNVNVTGILQGVNATVGPTAHLNVLVRAFCQVAQCLAQAAFDGMIASQVRAV